MERLSYSIKTMSRKEVDIAIEWAAKEGWNPGLHDASCYYTADPRGFLIGYLGNEPIATISVIKYGESFGFLGFYIVRPEYRGKGYGIQIWNDGLKYLNGRNVGLDGVVSQQDNYRKSGFKLAYRHIRYEGSGGGNPSATSKIVKLSAFPFEAVNSYDRAFFPDSRSHFVESWIQQPGCDALGIIENGNLLGYGVIRECRSGYKIGPLFAESPALAESLFLALKSNIKPSDLVYLDIPEVNSEAVKLAERNNMNVVFETARMYTGEPPEVPLNNIFGVTSFEVG